MIKVQRVAIYGRVSTVDQTLGLSLETQRRESLRFVESLPDATVLYEFTDIESGLEDGREGYGRLLDLVRRDKLDTVVVWRYDRFGRNDSELILRFKELAQHHVQLLSVTEGPRDDFMMKLGFLLANEESRRISARVMPSMRSRAEQGLWQGEPPRGYMKDPAARGRLLVNENEAPLVRAMFTMAAEGKTPREISRWANNPLLCPYATARRGKGYLAPSIVKRVLGNPVYTGMVVWGRERFSKLDGLSQRPQPCDTWIRAKGQHDALVDQQTWDLTQQTLALLQTTPYSAKDYDRKTLLSGLVRCGLCDYACHADWNRQFKTDYHSYRCHVPGHGSVGGKKLDTYVVSHVMLLPSGPEIVDMITEQLEDAANIGLAEDEHYLARVRLEKRLDTATNLLLDGTLPRDAYLRQREQIERDLGQINAIAGDRDHRLNDYRRAVETCRQMLTETDGKLGLASGESLDTRFSVLSRYIEHVKLYRRGHPPVIVWQPWVRLVLEVTNALDGCSIAWG